MQHHAAVSQVMAHYVKVAEANDWARWAERRRRFSAVGANEFMVGLMLDQGQKAERAWDKANHMVTTQFQTGGGGNWWRAVGKAHHSTVRAVCKTGYDGKSYAENYTANKFQNWLRSAAARLNSDYDGDPRKIWNKGTPDEIQRKLEAFDGIGDALSKMGTFILVRQYGVAGGAVNRASLAVKPDVLLRRVCYRTGITGSESISDVRKQVAALQLASPADFDAAAWDIGRSHCFKAKPSCGGCPVADVCARQGM